MNFQGEPLMPMMAIKTFFQTESAAGILLGFAAILALVISNAGGAELYDHFLHIPIAIQIGDFSIDKGLLHWINDGLMAVFFLLVGIEIKREIMEGQLSSVSQISLPAVAALGGIAAPALIYAYFNAGTPDLRGWAIPAATDIAFAIGVLSLLSKRVPPSLKICLIAIAVLDDLAAIVIIALFYTNDLSIISLASAGAAMLVLAILNARNVQRILPYILVGIVLWACVLKSGVHATLAGVVLAFFIPLGDTKSDATSPALRVEHGIYPLVNFFILPLFAFANAGVSLAGITMDLVLHPVTLGIALGLFVGKQIGVFGLTFLGTKLRICKMPADISWRQYYGMALLTGIGFTMSLFIGNLAFDDLEHHNAVRLGVLSGSLLSGVLGYVLLRYGCTKHMKISPAQSG
jgi:NhaA family Na+:H+ antiporter